MTSISLWLRWENCNNAQHCDAVSHHTSPDGWFFLGAIPPSSIPPSRTISMLGKREKGFGVKSISRVGLKPCHKIGENGATHIHTHSHSLCEKTQFQCFRLFSYWLGGAQYPVSFYEWRLSIHVLDSRNDSRSIPGMGTHKHNIFSLFPLFLDVEVVERENNFTYSNGAASWSRGWRPGHAVWWLLGLLATWLLGTGAAGPEELHNGCVVCAGNDDLLLLLERLGVGRARSDARNYSRNAILELENHFFLTRPTRTVSWVNNVRKT